MKALSEQALGATQLTFSFPQQLLGLQAAQASVQSGKSVFACATVLVTPHPAPGCCCQNEEHRANLRHENPQQVGDAEESRGKGAVGRVRGGFSGDGGSRHGQPLASPPGRLLRPSESVHWAGGVDQLRSCPGCVLSTLLLPGSGKRTRPGWGGGAPQFTPVSPPVPSLWPPLSRTCLQASLHLPAGRGSPQSCPQHWACALHPVPPQLSTPRFGNPSRGL